MSNLLQTTPQTQILPSSEYTGYLLLRCSSSKALLGKNRVTIYLLYIFTKRLERSTTNRVGLESNPVLGHKFSSFTKIVCVLSLRKGNWKSPHWTFSPWDYYRKNTLPSNHQPSKTWRTHVQELTKFSSFIKIEYALLLLSNDN